MLPLGRFSVLRAGTCEDAYASIRTRHPGVHGFTPRTAESTWKINVNVLDLGRGRVIASESSAFSLSNVDDELVRIYLPLSRSAEIRTRDRRQPLAPGVVAVAPVGEFGCDFHDGFRGLITTFPRRVVADALSCFSGASDINDRLNTVSRDARSLDPVRRLLLSLVRAFDSTPEKILHERRFRHAHEELLLLHVAQALAEAGEEGDDNKSSSLYLVRAVDYIHEHLFDEIGPMAVATAAGCSLRNLQLLFRREFGQTITEMVRGLRLQSARDRLMRGAAYDSITTVAIESGFSHLSDFARHYRSAFGERPSQTLASARTRSF